MGNAGLSVMYQYSDRAEGTASMTSRAKASPELSPVVDRALQQAIEALGWDGEVIPSVSVLGMRGALVVRLDREAHARRQDMGTDRAVTDADTLAMWEWPQGTATFPPSAVCLVGAIIRDGGGPGERLGSARKWRGFASGAMVLPGSEKLAESLRLECVYAGVALLRQHRDQVEVVVEGSTARVPTARRSTVDRWLEEHCYGVLLERRPESVGTLL